MVKLKGLEELEIRGKVIVRVDYNVPIDKDKREITDDNRIVQSIPTIKYLLDNGAQKIILLSHMGRIKTEEDKVKNTLKIVKPRLEELIKIPVEFIDVTSGKELENRINNSKARVILVENTRYEDLKGKRESNNDQELAKEWANMADVFVFDAFGVSHRDCASNSIAKYLPSAAGFLMQNEVNKIDYFMENEIHPFTIIMGGAKVSDKILVIENLIDKCDYLIIGGAMAFTFLKAMGYNVGKSLVEDDKIDYCKNLINNYKNKIILPLDVVTQDRICNINEITDNEIGFDIGPMTINFYKENIKGSRKILINGTMGKNEEEAYANGTNAIFKAIEELNVLTLVGGGDTVAASQGYELGHKSTGGGATLEFLGGQRSEIFDSLCLDKRNEKCRKKIK